MFRLADELKRVDSERRELLREKEQLIVRVNMVQEALERQVEQSVELRKQVGYTRTAAVRHEPVHSSQRQYRCTCTCLLVEEVWCTAPVGGLCRPVYCRSVWPGNPTAYTRYSRV